MGLCLFHFMRHFVYRDDAVVMHGARSAMLLRSGPRWFVAWTSSTAVVLVKQTRHVVFFHEGTGGG